MMAINDNRTNISVYDKDEMYYSFVSLKDIPANSIIDVDAIGFSCVLIRTFVFDLIPYPYFVYTEYSNRTTLSEDLYFCNMAKKCLFRIKCDTSL